MQKYQVNQYTVGNILNWVDSGEIAIPEIQRPFVWKNSKVRDLIDSLYNGYPIGYIISWKNPDVRLKDGTKSAGKKILIDGQQRITALTTSIFGKQIIDKSYKTKVIKIAFHPIEEKFEVLNSAIKKDKEWVQDIAEILAADFSAISFVKKYLEDNPEKYEAQIERSIQRLRSILQRSIGMIDLDHNLSIESVTDIFIRINSKGVVLSQADFAMSKIAANEEYGGNKLRKAIDYFCHLAKDPSFYSHITGVDTAFAALEFFNKMSWLKDEKDDLYNPDYKDMLRVSFSYKFKRGKLSDLVSLLSGRNFETRTYEEEIAEDSFNKLTDGIETFMNKTLFKRFVMIIKSAGFVSPKIIGSNNVLNFAYTLYLYLNEKNVNSSDIEQFVKKWFVMSMLTGRYSGSSESQFDKDLKLIVNNGIEKALADIESASLGASFWKSGLPQKLITSSVNAPALHVFWASQIRKGDEGFLSKDITVKDMIEHRGDIHHVFPKKYLKEKGLSKSQYNQVANYVYAQQEINIKIGKKAPEVYMNVVKDQCNGGEKQLGGITDKAILEDNLKKNCIPQDIFSYTHSSFTGFLEKRRELMSEKIKEFYEAL